VVLAAVVVGAVMALSGGFGARHAPLLSRLAYGETLILVGVGLGFGGSRLLLPRPWFETRPVLAASLMTIIVGLPMTLVAAVGECLMEGVAFSMPDLALVFPTTLATTLGITVLAFMVQSRVVAQTHDAAKGAPPPRFLARMPAKLAGASLWAVQAEDHYLRLHTSRGEDLILMRLADALVELEGIEGARTHRSWWVARAAVAGVDRAEGRATLTLPGGLEAPVSRAYMKALRQAGWF
jgi:DNA-binding LytR/AlgR family response regulator